jgi:hypothetical protein
MSKYHEDFPYSTLCSLARPGHFGRLRSLNSIACVRFRVCGDALRRVCEPLLHFEYAS